MRTYESRGSGDECRLHGWFFRGLDTGSLTPQSMSAPASAAYLPPDGESDGGVLLEIVADGGRQLGFGHVGRCLALWEALQGCAGFRVTDEAVAEFLRSRGVTLIAAGSSPVVLLDRAHPVDVREVAGLQAQGRRVALLDDLGAARMNADVVIDPPTAAAWPPAAGRRLAGFEHVLLRREVCDATVVAHGDGLLLAMGGSDPAGLTAPLSAALTEAGLELTVALGPGYAGSPPARQATPIASGEFVSALSRSALLVCGYGHSLLEAAFLGVPAVAVVFREEHLPHARAFCSNETAQMLDMTTGPRPLELVSSVERLLGDAGLLARMARRGRELVDGRGAARVATALEALA
jgi:UDP-2,4-diacetamido-2,4,6-trideoxy-beta-L-altropyranose hydrolase